jgi:hypothetical protein
VIKYNVFVWSSDYETFTGEGLLARCFVENYFQNGESIKIRSNNSEYLLKKSYFFLRENKYFSNFLTKYIYPFYGILLIWYYHFRGKQTCYVNYLPLWNFFIFILLPKKTILGPITGNIFRNDVYSFNTFFRKKIFPIFYFISLKIIFSKYKNVIFSTDNLKEIIPKKNIKFCLFNFCLLFFNQRKFNRKKIDFLFYFRKHPLKSNLFITYMIKRLASLNLNIAVVGDKFIYSNVKNYINIPRSRLLKLLDQTRYSIVSGDNFYSLFFLDCLSCNVISFVNKELQSNKNISSSYIKPLNFNNCETSFREVKRIFYLKKKNSKEILLNNFLLKEQKNILHFLKYVY